MLAQYYVQGFWNIVVGARDVYKGTIENVSFSNITKQKIVWPDVLDMSMCQCLLQNIKDACAFPSKP